MLKVDRKVKDKSENDEDEINELRDEVKNIKDTLNKLIEYVNNALKPTEQ